MNQLLCRAACAVFLAVVPALPGLASSAERINTLDRTGLFGYDSTGIAIRGYDTVAYWTEGAPIEGDASISSDWEGATWRFASQEHKSLFDDDPARYAPQYGGYCAYGVAQNDLIKIEPDNWTIVDDKLYLNYDDGVQRKWEKDIPRFIVEADDRFQGLLESN